MDVLRGRLVGRLQEADAHDRLRIYYPRLAEDPHTALMVHAKVMVIDDAFLRVGSSNLSNRSMGLDSECDLALAAEPDDTAQQKIIAGVRSRLLAEHLGCTADEVARAMEDHAGLIAAVEALRGGERTLAPLAVEIPPEVDDWVPDADMLDPEKPVSPEKLFDLFVSPREQPAVFRHAVENIPAGGRRGGTGRAVALDTPGRQGRPGFRPRPGRLDSTAAPGPAAWWGRSMFWAVSSRLPVTLMIIATVLVFGTWPGLVYALAGSWLSAIAVFGIGRWMGRATVRRFAGSLINRLSRKLSESRPGDGDHLAHPSGGPFFGHQPHRRCFRNPLARFRPGHPAGITARGHRGGPAGGSHRRLPAQSRA